MTRPLLLLRHKCCPECGDTRWDAEGRCRRCGKMCKKRAKTYRKYWLRCRMAKVKE